MRNLGKILYILIFSTMLYGKVVATVSPSLVYEGEVATYKLKISGNNIAKPILNDICGYNIVGTSSQTSIEMINGNYNRSYTLSYQFVPQKSCTISPKEIEVDGKKEFSNSVRVTVKPPSQDKKAPFIVTLKASKEDLIVGEPFRLTLELKQSKRADALDSKFTPPDFKGFWIKSQSQTTRSETDEYVITKMNYTLAPQREGNFTIKPAQLQIATRDNVANMWGGFMPQVKWRSYFSNRLNFNVSAPPLGAKLVGDFKISATADKDTITQNEAVNVIVKVVGDGDLEDIESFKPYINGVNSFDEKIQVKGDTLTQKIAFVADSDFTIPPFKLTFYNLKTKKLQTIQTKPIKIKVKGGLKNDQVDVKVAKENVAPIRVKSTTNSFYLIVAFISGLLVGIFAMSLKKREFFKKDPTKTDIKDHKVLFMKLLPYKNDKDVKKILDDLEKSIYLSQDVKIDYKAIKELLKKYNI